MSKLTDEEIKKIASTPAAVVGSYVHTFARAIEAAATEPLLQRIAHLEATASANYGRGHADAHSMLSERIAELEEARKDAELYRQLRNGNSWPAVFASHDAPEPLRGEELDAAMQKGQS